MGDVMTAEPSVRNTATFESVWATLDRITQRQEEFTESQRKGEIYGTNGSKYR